MKVWNEKEEETRKLVPKHFHKWIQIFGKKASKWMLTRKKRF